MCYTYHFPQISCYSSHRSRIIIGHSSTTESVTKCIPLFVIFIILKSILFCIFPSLIAIGLNKVWKFIIFIYIFSHCKNP